MTTSPDALIVARTVPPHALPPKAPDAATGNFWGSDGFTFGDLLDAINPLQHIPIISALYRSATDDDLSAGSRLIGGGLFGGPIGFVVSLFNAILAETSGKDLGEHVIAAIAAPGAAEGKDAPASAIASDAIPPGAKNWGSPSPDRGRGAPDTAANDAAGPVPPAEDALDGARAWLAARIEREPIPEITAAAPPPRASTIAAIGAAGPAPLAGDALNEARAWLAAKIEREPIPEIIAAAPPVRRPTPAADIRLALAAYNSRPDAAGRRITVPQDTSEAKHSASRSLGLGLEG
ncbi:MAG: hypothetical protein IIA01_01565 [Proteobacteria bacterium]|nr:hypothetical protein [Pseudomonadota bacterium]